MNIYKWNHSKGDKGQMVRISIMEAMELIRSLSIQILKDDPNYDRKEFFTDDGEYFSVSVHGGLK